MNIKKSISIAVILLAISNLEAMAPEYKYTNTAASINKARTDFNNAIANHNTETAELIVKALEKAAPKNKTTFELRAELNKQKQQAIPQEGAGEKDARIAELEIERQQLSEQLRQANNTIDNLQERLQQKPGQPDTEKITRLEQELANERQSLLEKQEKINETKSAMAKLRQDFSQKMSDLENKTAAQTDIISTLEQQLQRSNTDLTRITEEYKKLQTELKTGKPDTEKITKLEQELANCIQIKENQEEIITGMKNEMIEQQNKMAQQQAEFDQKLSEFENKAIQQERNLTEQIGTLRRKAIEFELILEDHGIHV